MNAQDIETYYACPNFKIQASLSEQSYNLKYFCYYSGILVRNLSIWLSPLKTDPDCEF